jgi:hypothetical protein
MEKIIPLIKQEKEKFSDYCSWFIILLVFLLTKLIIVKAIALSSKIVVGAHEYNNGAMTSRVLSLDYRVHYSIEYTI